MRRGNPIEPFMPSSPRAPRMPSPCVPKTSSVFEAWVGLGKLVLQYQDSYIRSCVLAVWILFFSRALISPSLIQSRSSSSITFFYSCAVILLYTFILNPFPERNHFFQTSAIMRFSSTILSFSLLALAISSPMPKKKAASSTSVEAAAATDSCSGAVVSSASASATVVAVASTSTAKAAAAAGGSVLTRYERNPTPMLFLQY